MDLTQITIKTKRLKLVPVSEKYIEHIFLEFRLPTTRYMNYTSTGSFEELSERHKKWQEELKNGVRLFMAVLLQETEEFLGCFALENLDTNHPEMGGWLKQSAHGNRYGQEAVLAIKQWADENINYDYIIWPCAKMNIPSRKLAESLSGKVYKEYEKKTANGTIFPSVEYRISKN